MALSFSRRAVKPAGLPAPVRALYTAVSGALRCSTAGERPLLRRVSWVKSGMAELDAAVAMTDPPMYITRWLRAVVCAQLPARFDAEAVALQELQWAETHIGEAPASGLLRELRFQQAAIYRRRGDTARALALLKASGYPSFNRPFAMNSPFAIDPELGFRFDAPTVVEVSRKSSLTEIHRYGFYLILCSHRFVLGLELGCACAPLFQYRWALQPGQTLHVASS